MFIVWLFRTAEYNYAADLYLNTGLSPFSICDLIGECCRKVLFIEELYRREYMEQREYIKLEE